MKIATTGRVLEESRVAESALVVDQSFHTNIIDQVIDWVNYYTEPLVCSTAKSASSALRYTAHSMATHAQGGGPRGPCGRFEGRLSSKWIHERDP